jgi:hypothetical protein
MGTVDRDETLRPVNKRGYIDSRHPTVAVSMATDYNRLEIITISPLKNQRS